LRNVPLVFSPAALCVCPMRFMQPGEAFPSIYASLGGPSRAFSAPLRGIT
jgi:hypothetical protein